MQQFEGIDMTLQDVVSKIDEFDEDQTIYLQHPWTHTSTAIVEFEPDDGGLPSVAEELGLGYFVEVAVAREVLEDWESELSTPPAVSEQCKRLIQYAATEA